MANINGVNTGQIPNDVKQNEQTDRAARAEKRAAHEVRQERAAQESRQTDRAEKRVANEVRQERAAQESRRASKDEENRGRGGSGVDVKV